MYIVDFRRAIKARSTVTMRAAMLPAKNLTAIINLMTVNGLVVVNSSTKPVAVESDSIKVDFSERVRINQRHLNEGLKPHYDFIVCGSGSSGSAIAGRLAENPNASILLLEAGGNDDVSSIMDPDRWLLNLGTEREWGFSAQPNPNLNGRSISQSMGKVLGGGSSINGLMWTRGHRHDWDFSLPR